MHVAVIYSKGPAWTDSDAAQDQIEAHKAYQHRNFEAGKLVMGGPFIDEAGGMAIYEAQSKEEVEAIVQNDPAVKSGFYLASLHSWRIAVRRPPSR